MEKGRLNREIWGLVLSVCAVLIVISLISYSPADRSFNTPSGAIETKNWGGFVGAYLADWLLQGLGYASYLVPLFLALAAAQLFRASAKALPPVKVTGLVVFLIAAAALLSLFIESDSARDAGGIVGGFLNEAILIPLFGPISAALITLAAALLSLMLVTQNTLGDVLSRSARLVNAAKSALLPAVKSRIAKLQQKSRERAERRKGENTRKERREFTPPPIVVKEETKEESARKATKRPPVAPEQFKLPQIGEAYRLPPLDLLDAPHEQAVKLDRDSLQANSIILQKKLADFGVEGEVVAVRPGPVITMYEFKPAPGVKVRRIVTLADDLAMALRAVSVRILAPIPGESVVGIEIPNPRRETVHLRQVIESEAYQTADSKLTLALGKDIGGLPFVSDLGRMPHLLVAGATGTGKSVSI
ncbi:MAG TPA: DNA translocase FtsK 4TM domain-containing protein, partial [Candidatus Eisenbacteria bacterium]|nr:DNA translocase FtsK 4TM domain-containing protein [Candidatus Eisenbacteria bacterium]